ncbi:MAG: glycosyltransferase [Mastigocoleus sp.]
MLKFCKKNNLSIPIYFDIVTITKNSQNVVKKTLDSVSNQTYQYINHIIIDGNSTDDTINTIQNFHHQKNLILYKEVPKGISHAFNTGLNKHFGTLVIFLNSGDVLIGENVVEKIVESYLKNEWFWAFGETISVSRKGYLKRYIKQYPQWQQELFFYGNPICHQSTIFSKNILNQVGFYNESLSLGMDYDYNIRASLISEPYLLRFPISYYDTTGVSSRKVFKSFQIQSKLRKKYFSMTKFHNFIIDNICFYKALKRFFMLPIKLFL